MSELFDLNSYRQSSIIAQDIGEIRLLLREIYKELAPYKKYLPVKTILNEVIGAEVVLKNFEKAHKKVVKNKGKQ